jgi:hypothetical protein
MIIRIQLDNSRSLLFGHLGAKHGGLFLDPLSQGILVTEDERGGFAPAPPTFPDRSFAQDLRGIVSLLYAGDPRLGPFQLWVDEHGARISEIRRKTQPPDPLQTLLGQIHQQARENVE